jgi:hypothetical protein
VDLEDGVWIIGIHSVIYLHHYFKTESQEATSNKEIKEKQIILLFW